MHKYQTLIDAMKAGPTQGPWVHDKRGYPCPDIKAASGRNVACTWGVNNQPRTPEAYKAQTEIARANAAFIVAACNSAPSLLEDNERLREALEKVLPYLQDGANHGDDAVHLLPIATSALSLTGAKP